MRITERNNSRESTHGVENPTVNLGYTVQGTEDDVEVKTLVESTIPAFYLGLQFQSFRQTHKGGGVWDIDATYSKKKPLDVGDMEFSFDTKGGSETLQQALNSSYIASTERPFPDPHNGVINAHSGDGGVLTADGVEVSVPNFSFTVTRVLAHPLDATLVNNMYSMTGKINSHLVVLTISGLDLEFAAGELKYDGGGGSLSGNDKWRLVLEFSASQNATGIEIANILPFDKKGWQYVWFDYDTVVSSGHRLRMKPVQANIEDIFEEADLNALFA